MRNPFKSRDNQTSYTVTQTDEAKTKYTDDVIDTHSEDGDENKERGNWSNPIEFLLSLIGYAVGLGNLWRFPYLCMRNGGGAFLVPYFTFLLLCGIPLFYLEVAVGQFSSLSSISIWKVSPLFQGLGWGMIIVSGFVAVYYNLIITWVLYYLGNSFNSNLPWADCTHPWNTAHCIRKEAVNITLQGTTENPVYSALTNQSSIHQSPANEFWEYKVLQRSPGIGDFDGIHWELLLCLIASWLLVFFCLIKGIKSSGKVVYVTATVPYVLLFCLLIRGVTLPGARDGILYYITPDVNRLLELRTWAEACLQIFYSLGPAWGALVTMASYNKFHHNCLRDAIIIPLVNCGTSFFAGFVIFSIIGFMAQESGQAVSEVIKSGPGLVFIAYPEAISRMPVAPLWAVMFFVMLLTLGLDTQFGMVETLVSGIVDHYPRTMKYKPLVAGCICLVSLVVGLPFVTRAGLYYFQIVDWYSAMFSVTLIGFLECMVFAWVYGWNRIFGDIEMMLGSRPSQIWRILWCFITPALLLGVIVFSCIQMGEPYYGDYYYPRWAIGMGWVISMLSIIPIPLAAVWQLTRVEGTLLQRLKKSVRPDKDWGPALEKYRVGYKYDMHLEDIATGRFHGGDTIFMKPV